MRILLVNHYAGSKFHGMEFRPYYLAREWVRSGHEVVILASTFSHLRQANPTPIEQWAREAIDGVTYQWVRGPSYVGNGIGRVRNILSFSLRISLAAKHLAERWRPEVVIASSTYPFDIFGAHAIAKRAGARLAFEVHDLWPLTPIEIGGMSPRHPFIVAASFSEAYAYRTSDVVVSMLPAASRYMQSRGMPADRFHYIPNGISVDEWVSGSEAVPGEAASAIADLRVHNSTVVGYAGSHGLANALDVLLAAAGQVRDAGIGIVLVGQGPERERLMAMAGDQRLANVRFVPAIPKGAIPALLNSLDALYLGWRRSPLYRFGISPNKLLDYMMAAKPIVHAVDAANDPVSEAGCGISVCPDDPAAIAGALRQVASLSAAEGEAMGARGRAFVREKHDYRVLARQFVDVLSA